VVDDDVPLQTTGTSPCAGEGSQARVAALAAAGGAAGLIFLGPFSGAAFAAGVAYTVLGEAGGATAALEASGVREWAGNLKLPERCAGSGDLLRQFSGTAQAALTSARTGRAISEAARAAEVLGHGFRTVCSSLADGALAERERAIAGLARELEVVERDGLRERGEFTQRLQDEQRASKETTERLTAELKAAERAKVEEIARLEKDLDGARRAKEQDCSRLVLELEIAKRAGEEAGNRLRRELRCAEEAREQELARLARELEAAERLLEEDAGQLQREVEAGRELSSELESMKRVREESTCCICMEAPRQVLFLPCRHVCCCEACSQQLQRCPVDRTLISEQIRFTMA